LPSERAGSGTRRVMTSGMRLIRTLVLGAALLSPAFADDGKSPSQQSKKERTDKAAKKGALEEKADPAADLARQKANVERLERNAAEDRKAGNRAGAWAAEWDERHAKKLIEKDQKLLRDH